MTRNQNRKYLRLGLNIFGAANVIFITILVANNQEWIAEGSFLKPVLVLFLILTAIPSFVLLVILGTMPHLLRLQDKHLLSSDQQEKFAPMSFFVLED